MNEMIKQQLGSAMMGGGLFYLLGALSPMGLNSVLLGIAVIGTGIWILSSGESKNPPLK